MENTNHTNISKPNQQFVRGWSWGNVNLSNGQIEFTSADQSWFNVPYYGISNVQATNKNEIALEFNLDEDADTREDMLCEMRLYVPNRATADNMEVDGRKEDKSDAESASGKSDRPVKVTTAELLKEEISKLANVGTVSESIAHLSDIQMITPRGKFEVYFMKNQTKIHGQTHNYKISHKNISKVFLLPKPDGHHSFFAVALAHPIRQGNTTHHFLVFQIKNKSERTVTLNLPESESERRELLKVDIPPILTGELVDILAKLFQAVVGIGIVIPGKAFKTGKGTHALKCSLKANEGYLYPLEKSMIFLHKPVLCINLEDVRYVECARVHESNVQQRSFDITVVTKKEEFQFVGIEKSEFENVVTYFSNKKIKLNNKDGGNKVVDIKPSNTTSTNRRQKKLEEKLGEEVPDLPSDESLIDDDDYSSGDGDVDMDGDEASASEEESVQHKKKEIKKGKGKK